MVVPLSRTVRREGGEAHMPFSYRTERGVFDERGSLSPSRAFRGEVLLLAVKRVLIFLVLAASDSGSGVGRSLCISHSKFHVFTLFSRCSCVIETCKWLGSRVNEAKGCVYVFLDGNMKAR